MSKIKKVKGKKVVVSEDLINVPDPEDLTDTSVEPTNDDATITDEEFNDVNA